MVADNTSLNGLTWCPHPFTIRPEYKHRQPARSALYSPEHPDIVHKELPPENLPTLSHSSSAAHDPQWFMNPLYTQLTSSGTSSRDDAARMASNALTGSQTQAGPLTTEENDGERPTSSAPLVTHLPTPSSLPGQSAPPEEIVSAADRKAVRNLNHQGINTKTRKAQQAAWSSWMKFIHSRNPTCPSKQDPFLQKCDSEEGGVLLILFIQWLRTSERMAPHLISNHFSKVKSNWTTERKRMDCFSTITKEEMKRVMKALKPSATETRARLASQRLAIKYPAAVDMITCVRDDRFSLLDLNPLSATLLDAAGAYLACILTQEAGQRGCNIVGSEETNVLMTADVRFQMGVGEPNVNGEFTNVVELTGQRAREEILGAEGNGFDRNLQRILEIRVDFTGNKIGIPQPNVIIARRTSQESQIVEDMGRWLVHSKTKDDDPFMTRYALPKSGRGKPLRRKVRDSDCCRVVRQGAERLGLPPQFFSVKSLRSSAVSAMAMADATTEEIQNRTWHHSNVVNTHYNFAKPSNAGGRGRSIGPAALSGASNQFNANAVRQMMPRASLNAVEKGRESERRDPVSRREVSDRTGEAEEGRSGRGMRRKRQRLPTGSEREQAPQR